MTTRKSKADVATETPADTAADAVAVAEPRVLVIGAGMNAGVLIEQFGEVLEYPAELIITNSHHKALVLSQAQPIRVIDAGESVQHTVNNPAQLHDVIFGMVAVGDRLERDTIGTITQA